jgi:hypothetical protein
MRAESQYISQYCDIDLDIDEKAPLDAKCEIILDEYPPN